MFSGGGKGRPTLSGGRCADTDCGGGIAGGFEAGELGQSHLSQTDYAERGRFSFVNICRRFGTFSRAVKVFLRWHAGVHVERVGTRRGPRTVNLRLRFAVLSRDGYRCCACGRSPPTEAGVRLQVDHVVPWSKGGESVAANLQTLCWECNSGKWDIV